MAVHITGTMGLPSGAVYPNCEMYFERKVGVVSQEGHAVIPEKTIVRSNASAAVDFYLLFGEYIGTIQTTLGVVKFAFSVLDVASATFVSCIGSVSVPIPEASVQAAIDAAIDAADSAELARIYSLQAGSYFEETDLEMGSIVIPTEITIISRIPDGASLDQVAVASELSWWKRTTPPTSQPYFTTSGGVVWTQVGYRESQVLSTVHSALQGAYGSVRNFATRADVLSWIALNPAPAVGSVLNWGGLSVRYLGTGTVISDMAGYVPNGIATPEHHGWTAALSTALQTAKIIEALQAGYPEVSFAGGNTYLVDYVYAVITAPLVVRLNGATIKGAYSSGFETSEVIRIDCTSAMFPFFIFGDGGTVDGSLRDNIPSEGSASGLVVFRSNFVLSEGIHFFGGTKGDGKGDSGFVPSGCNDVTLRKCKFTGWDDHGCYNTGYGAGTAYDKSTGLVIDDCEFTGCGAGDIRLSRDYRKIQITNNRAKDGYRFVISSPPSSNPISAEQIIICGNIVQNYDAAILDTRFMNPTGALIVSDNQFFDWATTSAAPAIYVRGVSNVKISGNIIKPKDAVQASSTTSCTCVVNIYDDVDDYGGSFLSRNVDIYDNTFTVFDRSGDAIPPTGNVCIRDQTAVGFIRDNILNAYPFDIWSGASAAASIGSPYIRRLNAVGTGFGGAIPVSKLNTADGLSVIRGDTNTRSVLVDTGSTTLHRIVSYSPATSGRQFAINATTDASDTTPSGGAVALLLQTLGSTRLNLSAASASAVVPLGLWSRTVTQANAITTAPAGSMLYISNEVGGGTVAFYDGTNWRRVQDRVVIA